MATINFAEGADTSPIDLVNIINGMGQAVQTSNVGDTVVYELGDTKFTVGLTGSGFFVDTLVITIDEEPYVEITNINLVIFSFLLAVGAEADEDSTSAIEELILGLGWGYQGSDDDDLLLPDSVSEDGVLLNLTGNDVVHLKGGNDEFALGDGNDEAYAGTGADTLYGGAGNDLMYGQEGKDTLRGGEGDDVIIGGNGKDTIFGGAGHDVASYEEDELDGGTQGIVANLKTGEIIDTFGKTDKVKGVEEVWGTSFNDVIKGSAENEVFLAFEGKDTLSGKGGADFLDGGTGADILKGGAGNDILLGGYGKDTVNGGKGDDVLSGSKGDDTLNGGAGVDVADYSQNHISGGFLGIDADLSAGTVVDMFGNTDSLSNIEGVNGSIFNDSISGSDADETFNGNGGDDTLLGKKGADTLSGGDGDDALFGGKGADDLNGGADNDTLEGGKGADILSGGEGDDALLGGEGADDLNGGADDDTLEGGEGDDTLFGGEGSDTLHGGAGDDTLTGGAGSDMFVFFAGGGDDVVTDYQLNVDSINFVVDSPITAEQIGEDVLLTREDATLLILNVEIAELIDV